MSVPVNVCARCGRAPAPRTFEVETGPLDPRQPSIKHIVHFCESCGDVPSNELLRVCAQVALTVSR